MARDTAAIGEDVVIGENTPPVETTVEALIRAYNRQPLTTNLTTGDRMEWDGTKWIPAAAGTDTSLAVIAESVLGAAAASITFSSIPATYRHLQIVLTGRGDHTAVVVALRMRFNSDVGTNYDLQEIQGLDATTSSTGTLAATSMACGLLSTDASPAGSAGVNTIEVPDYAGTTHHKGVIANSGVREDASVVRQRRHWGQWRNTAAITAVELFPSAGNFKAGTVATLYGMKGA